MSSAPNPPAGPGPPVPGEEISIRVLTWPKLLSIIGALVGSAGLLIYLLLTLVYGGIEKKLDKLNAKIVSVDSNLNEVSASAIAIRDLLQKVRLLEQKMEVTGNDVSTVKQLTTAMQGGISVIKQQIEEQVRFLHSKPSAESGIPPVALPHNKRHR